MVEGLSPENGRKLCRWLLDDQPAVITSDGMQAEFGGKTGFEWGPPDSNGAVGPYPAFGPLGTVGERS
jgi:hypothetical protein